MLGYEHVEPNHATSWLGMATLFYTLHRCSVLGKLTVDWDFLVHYPAILPSLGTDCEYYQFSKFLSLKISTLRYKGREMDDYSRCSLNEYTKKTKYERNVLKEFPGQIKNILLLPGKTFMLPKPSALF